MKTRKHDVTFWLFLVPAIVAFLFVIVIPFFLGFYYSFTNWTSRPQPAGPEFVGLANFINSFQDSRFLYSFIITTLYTVMNVLLINVVAFGLALLVTSKIRLKNMFRAGFFIPHLIGGLILGYIWQFIFNVFIPNQQLLTALFPALAEPGNLVLANVNSALGGLVVAGAWQYAGYIMMIYIAAIVSVPGELFEAGRIDGASPLYELLHITIPMTAQAFTVTLFLTLVHSFKQFDVNVSLTGGGRPPSSWNGQSPAQSYWR